MVSGPVDFVGGYALNFAWKGRKKMFELLNVRSHAQFLKLIYSEEGTPDDMYEKIIFAGLITNHPELQLTKSPLDTDGTVYVEDLIERFFTEGNDQRKFDEIIEDALIVAGLLNGTQIFFGRKMRLAKNRDDIKKMLEQLDKTFGELEQKYEEQTQKEDVTVQESGDSGESLGSSQPTSMT